MKLAISYEVQKGLTWPQWMQLTAAVERLGFAGVSLSDHFAMGGDALETITALTYSASHSRTIQLGTLVSPLSFRDPVMLTRQALMIDSLSDGRMVLGIGSGWVESEHSMFGYDFGDVNTRLERFEEGVQVITQLARYDTPVTFEGRFYNLRNARLQTRVQHRMPILIGGNGVKRTLPIVAKYADIWNCLVASVDVFKERSALLDTLISQAGRKTGDVKRSLYLPVLCWRDNKEMEHIATRINDMPALAGLAARDVYAWWTTNLAAIAGTPDSVVEQLRAYETAGADQIDVIMYGALKGDIDYLESLAAHILPHFAA